MFYELSITGLKQWLFLLNYLEFYNSSFEFNISFGQLKKLLFSSIIVLFKDNC